jgi:hypothetical protein
MDDSIRSPVMCVEPLLTEWHQRVATIGSSNWEHERPNRSRLYLNRYGALSGNSDTYRKLSPDNMTGACASPLLGLTRVPGVADSNPVSPIIFGFSCDD